MTKTLRQLYTEAMDAQKSILDTAAYENRADLTLEESRAFNKLDEIIATLKENMDKDAEVDKRQQERHPTSAANPPKGRTASFSIGRNERTYNPDRDKEANAKPGGAFLLDAGRAYFGDVTAQERLQRHMQEEIIERPGVQLRSTTANFVGLVVPQYVVDLAAPAVANMRPFSDAIAHHDLPDTGMSVNISRITTPTAAGTQGTELTAVSTQDIDDTLLTLPVTTCAGSIALSRQAVERGTISEEVTTQDLLKRVATALDAAVLNTTTTGLSFAATAQTYTNATLDTTAVPAFWKQLIAAGNTVETNLLGQAPADLYVLHSRRWRWVTAAVSASWPVVAGTNAPPQNVALQLTNDYPGVRAITADGTKVVVDSNITTTGLAGALTGGTQDFAFCVASQESHLWEASNSPVLLRCEQPLAASLGVLFVAYEYYAFTHQRYSSSAVCVSGTGTATPSFA